MLSGRILPAHPQPQDDELFSSWLVRAAKANGQKLHPFCKMLFGDVQIWTRDIDRSVKLDIVQKLAAKLGTSPTRAVETTLSTFDGRLFNRYGANSFTPWILPMGIYHRTHRRYGLQYCPACLANDVIPYFRRTWRLALFPICIEHGLVLSDRCPVCGAAVMFHRRDFFDRNAADPQPFTACYRCGADITKSQILLADQGVINFLIEAQAVLCRGWVEIGDWGNVWSFRYFDVVRHLMKLVSINKACSIRLSRIGLSAYAGRLAPNQGIEYLNANSRHAALRVVAWLMQDWPNRFVTACELAHLSSAYLTRDFKDAPWWYIGPVRQFFFGGRY